jgi:hypothetical protein
MTRWRIIIIGAFLVSACQKSAIDPSDSLVGARELPTIEALSRETVELNRHGGTQTEPALLIGELRPDNTFEFKLTRHDLRHGEMVLGKETAKLAPEDAAAVRKNLWHLRPSKLEGIDKQVLPIGCYWMFDEPPEFTVVFIAPNRKDIGATDVQASCESPAAAASRKLVGDVLNKLPKSKLADGFWTEHQPLR